MMKRKWKPSSSQRRAFAEQMKDPEYATAYYNRKEEKAAKRRAKSKYDYQSAGGEYIPTRAQHDAAFDLLNTTDLTSEQEMACNSVIFGWTCQEVVPHDHIHIVNELRRNLNI